MRNSATNDNRAECLSGRRLYNLLYHFCVWLLLQLAGINGPFGVLNQEKNKTYSGFTTDNVNILNLVSGKRNVYLGLFF